MSKFRNVFPRIEIEPVGACPPGLVYQEVQGRYGHAGPRYFWRVSKELAGKHEENMQIISEQMSGSETLEAIADVINTETAERFMISANYSFSLEDFIMGKKNVCLHLRKLPKVFKKLVALVKRLHDMKIGLGKISHRDVVVCGKPGSWQVLLTPNRCFEDLRSTTGDLSKEVQKDFLELARVIQESCDVVKSRLQTKQLNVFKTFAVNAEHLVFLVTDFIQNAEEALTVDQVLSHPFFLDDEEKLKFLEQLSEYIVSNGVKDDFALHLVECMCGSKTLANDPYRDWFDKLDFGLQVSILKGSLKTLKDNNLKKQYRAKINRRERNLERWTALELGEECPEIAGSLYPTSIVGIMRVLRNRIAHPSEDPGSTLEKIGVIPQDQVDFWLGTYPSLLLRSFFCAFDFEKTVHNKLTRQTKTVKVTSFELFKHYYVGSATFYLRGKACVERKTREKVKAPQQETDMTASGSRPEEEMAAASMSGMYLKKYLEGRGKK